MTQIVKPKVNFDPGPGDSAGVRLLHGSDRFLNIVRRRKHERSSQLVPSVHAGPEQRAEIVRHRDCSTRGLRFPERVENCSLPEVYILDPYPRHFFRPHARVQHNSRDVAEWMARLGQIGSLLLETDHTH